MSSGVLNNNNLNLNNNLHVQCFASLSGSYYSIFRVMNTYHICYLKTFACQNLLILRGIMVGRHFHVNIKVQVAMCKDKNNSKSRVATYLKFDICRLNLYIIFSVQKIRFLISASNSKTLNFIIVRRQKSSFRDNVLGRNL